jgi:hypothetical protein
MNKKHIKEIVSSLPLWCSKIIIIVYFFVSNNGKIYGNWKEIGSYQKKGICKEKAFWKSMYRVGFYLYQQLDISKYLSSYFDNNDFKCLIKNINISNNPKDVVLICCEKNDLERIKSVYEWHRKIGIKNIVFVDNNSDDGTKDWLKDKDVVVYSTNEKYHASRKAAWYKRIMDIYGYNRWYLIVDSDELFTYIGCENHSIDELIQYAENMGIKRIRSFLLDMYSEGKIFNNTKANVNIIEDNKYFDYMGYYSERDFRSVMIKGGPRKRVFYNGQDDKTNPLTKYPLLYVKSDDIWTDHIPYPFKYNHKSDCLAVLRHYKFGSNDLNKYIQIAYDENYYNNSVNYKRYIEVYNDNNDISFVGIETEEYVNSKSLGRINFLKNIFKDEV